MTHQSDIEVMGRGYLGHFSCIICGNFRLFFYQLGMHYIAMTCIVHPSIADIHECISFLESIFYRVRKKGNPCQKMSQNLTNSTNSQTSLGNHPSQTTYGTLS